MKKQLLLGSALLFTVTAFPQKARERSKTNPVNMRDVIATKFALNESTTPSKLNNITPQQSNLSENEKTASPQSTNISWKLIGGAMNAYGMIESTTRPLQYNDNVNGISFIHRKSASYTSNPSGDSNSGTIVAEISTDWGATFDSTAIYAHAVDAGRYPQGGIYSAPGNTNIANAYVVGTGVVVSSGSSFTGNFYASKKLDVYNNTPDVAPGAQQYVSFSQATYPANFQRHGWSRNGFSSTDDGLVRSLALIADNHLGDGNPRFARGVGIVKGTFNAGTFNWTMDSIIPPILQDGVGDGNLLEGQMVWNEAGTTGYVVIPGVLAAATGNNIGVQPIIYKTTNSGVSWSQLSSIDFNSTAMQPITNHLYTIGAGSPYAAPYMTDWDITVDANDNLHIGAIFASGASHHPDSIFYIQQFQVGTYVYKYGHAPGDRPYLYDFVGDGTSAWVATLVDSLPTEDPGSRTTDPGYNENPWDPTGTGSAKMNIEPRLQMGRTPDGQYITYSWAESDTNFTNNAHKYNVIPNIKTRLAKIGAGTSMTVSPTELNATKYPASQGVNNAEVNSRATFKYMSPTTSAATVVASAGSSTVDVMTPFTVTNSNPYGQLTNNTIWFSAARLSYEFPAPLGLTDYNAESVTNSVVYPNPAKTNATLSINLKNNSAVSIEIYNTIGQLMKTEKVQGQIGENNINLDLNKLSSGIYMVTVKTGNAMSTKKLVIE